jgi:hypothetical protein
MTRLEGSIIHGANPDVTGAAIKKRVPENFTRLELMRCGFKARAYSGLPDLLHLFTCMDKQHGRGLSFCLGYGYSILSAWRST